MHRLRSVEKRAMIASLNGISMRHNIQRPRTSITRMASRTLFALAAALPLAVAADVTVNVTVTSPQAFESNPSNYGEIKVTRSAALTSTLVLGLDLNKGFTTGKKATYLTDYTLVINPADAAKATLDVTNAATGSLVLTFNSGFSDARIQVIAVPDAATLPPELAEAVSISLPILPPSSGIVAGANQRGTVTIVDANVQLATYIDQTPAREILKDDINNYVQGAGDGRMRLWFPNSSAFSSIGPVTSYAPYGNRFVEISNAGSSATAVTDFASTYRIGGNQRCVETFGLAVEPTVTVLRSALRETSEYGITSYFGSGFGTGVFPGYSDSVSGQVIVTGAAGVLSSMSVEPFTIPSGAAIKSITIAGTFVDLTAGGRSIAYSSVSAGALAGKSIIYFIGFTVPAPLGEGSSVDIFYTVTTTGTTATVTPGNAITNVTMPILYPIGATSLSVTQGASSVLLTKGDVMVVDGGTYRVTGTKLTAGGGGSLGDYEIFFTPGLRRNLLRTSPLKIQTHFEAKFDNVGRETFFILALPTTPYYGYPTGQPLDIVNGRDEAVAIASAFPTNGADLPEGDWVDLLFRPIDDAEVEGREDILITLNVTNSNNGFDVISPEVARIPIGDNDVLIATELTANAQIPTGDGTFLVELSQTFPDDVFVPFKILQNGTTDAVFGADYTIANTLIDTFGNVTGVVKVPKGSMSVTVSVSPIATSLIALNASKSIRVVLDDSLDYALAGSVSGGSNASTSTITITRTPTNTNPVPVITSPLVATWNIGDPPFSYSILTTGVTPTSYNAIGLPPGLTIDKTTGSITGTPTTVGVYSVGLQAYNGATAYGSANLIISVKAQIAPVITSILTLSGTYNVGLSYQITANGNPTTFGATGLPAGLSVSTTGVITGTPSASGTFPVAISATNSGGSGSATLVITIAAGLGPVISSPLTAVVTAGTPFSYPIVASGATSYNATGLPNGLVVNLTTGVITGTPTAAGVTSVAISATNAGGTSSATLVITVNAAAFPVISSATTASAVVGTAFSYQITASGNPTAYTATPLPAGLTVNLTTGVIAGTPTTIGSTSTTLGATNTGGTGTATLVISVTASPTGTTTGTLPPGNGDGGACGAGSGLAALLGSLSLVFLRFIGRRR